MARTGTVSVGLLSAVFPPGGGDRTRRGLGGAALVWPEAQAHVLGLPRSRSRGNASSASPPLCPATGVLLAQASPSKPTTITFYLIKLNSFSSPPQLISICTDAPNTCLLLPTGVNSLTLSGFFRVTSLWQATGSGGTALVASHRGLGCEFASLQRTVGWRPLVEDFLRIRMPGGIHLFICAF